MNKWTPYLGLPEKFAPTKVRRFKVRYDKDGVGRIIHSNSIALQLGEYGNEEEEEKKTGRRRDGYKYSTGRPVGRAKGFKMSEEAKAKISAAKTGVKRGPNKTNGCPKGYKQTAEHIANKTKSRGPFKHSEETKAKISAAKKGHIVSEETRAKMSAAKKGVKRKPLTAEHIAKIQAARAKTFAERKLNKKLKEEADNQ